METYGLSLPRTATEPETWQTFFQQGIATNVRFWLDQITTQGPTAPLLYLERKNIMIALDWALQLRDAWDYALKLLLSFHPFAERYGAWVEWERFLEAGLRICRRQNMKALQAALLDRLGELKRHQGDWLAAATCHRTACDLSAEAGEDATEARASANLGYVFLLLQRYEEAYSALNQALIGYQATENLSGQATVYNNLGLVWFDQRQWDRSLYHHQKAYQLWSRIGNAEGMARAQHNTGNAYRKKSDWLKAESCLQSAINLYEQTNSRLRAAVAAQDLGNVYLEQDRPEQAEAFYHQAREAMQQMGHKRGLAQVFNNLGMTSAQRQDWTIAESYFQRSVVLWNELGQPVSQANVEDNLAEAYIRQGKGGAARQLLVQAQERLSQLEPTARVKFLLREIDVHLKQVT